MPRCCATIIASLLSSSHGHSLLIVTESSCQFFMNMPMTSYPCCCNRYAATLESTPPDKPTTTLFFISYLLAVKSSLRSAFRSKEHTSELQSILRISYDVFCL